MRQDEIDMQEGWAGSEYVIFFEDDEILGLTQQYSLANHLPGFTAIGIRGWDDFIVNSSTGDTFKVPTIPLDSAYLEPYAMPTQPLVLDDRFVGKIKWYVTPLIFGGSPSISENAIWVTYEQHIELVAFWNKQYHTAKGR